MSQEAELNQGLLRNALNRVANLQKVAPSDYMELYQQIHSMFQCKQLEQTNTFLFNVLVENLSVVIADNIVSKLNSSNIASERDLITVWEKHVKPLDAFVQRLLKGRLYFQSSRSETFVLASSLFEAACQNKLVAVCESFDCESAIVDVVDTKTRESEILNNFHNSLTEYYRTETLKTQQHYNGKNLFTDAPIPRHKFTRTKNLIHDAPPNWINFSQIDEKLLQKVDIQLPKECAVNDGPPIAFYVDGVLTNEECDQIVVGSSKFGYKTLEHEFLKEERDNDRALIKSVELSNVLWKRLEPVLKKDDYVWNGLRPYGWHNEGKWQPVSINPCMRCCKYTAPCVGFVPHRDGNFVPSVDERSKFTIILYLNDDFPEGTTDFLRAHEPAYMGELVREELQRGYTKEYSLKPKKGRCLIFDHALLHQGAPITHGKKFIIRTDIVLKRVENDQPDMTYLTDPDYFKMLYYYKIAANYECQGMVNVSSEYYERALSLRMHFPRKLQQLHIE